MVIKKIRDRFGWTQSEAGYKRGMVWQRVSSITPDGATDQDDGQRCTYGQSVLDPVPECS